MSTRKKASKRKTKRSKTPEKKRMTVSRVILLVAIIAINLFTAACLFIQYATSTEVSSTLTTCWFAFWTSEIFSLAGIKIVKVRKSVDGEAEEEEGTDTIEEGDEKP